MENGLGQNLKIFDTRIPHSVRAAECSISGMSIYSFDSNGKLASAYEDFTKGVENLEERKVDRSWDDWVPELHENRLIIDSFHVSRAFRRCGIGRRLVETAADYARGRGARALYASCCSAKETIAFYRAMGFGLSEHPIPSCVEEEPFDIQMECRL